ncbi:hypothetical protein BC826DRAFT_1052854 [Russula brevipes]|nr:hypothetical protein BC826DRAFT_1052854 [Russula brevipes]
MSLFPLRTRMDMHWHLQLALWIGSRVLLTRALAGAREQRSSDDSPDISECISPQTLALFPGAQRSVALNLDAS